MTINQEVDTSLSDSNAPTMTNCDTMDAAAQSAASTAKARRLSEFYAGKTVLVTGATGFIGKVCLVKMVKSLEKCERIYVMLRPKRGLNPQQRFNKMLNEEPFAPRPICLTPDELAAYEKSQAQQQQQQQKQQDSDTKEQNIFDWSKVHAVEGDMSRDELGLSDDVKATLCSSVDIVFNIAASVQFDAPLKQNLRDNYMGTRNLLQLCTKFTRLVSLVHVSTFYSNSHLSHVEERVLPMARDSEKMAELISWMPDSLCDMVAPQIMENRPNTYIYTKAMSENLVQRFEGRLPLAIVRPSIVTPSHKEPYAGWVDNVNGPMGLGILASLGILRNIDWNYYGISDTIPVDHVVNCMLAVAERTARAHPRDIKVYNCSSSSLNPLTWGQMFEALRKEGLKSPPYKMLRLPIEVPKHERANRFSFAMTKFSELMFAYFIDFILTICGQKPVLVKLTAKLHHGYKILQPFTTTQYTCNNDNLLACFEELDEHDKREFDFDVRKIDWQAYSKYSYYGARWRLLKEDISNVHAATLKMRILMVVEFLFRCMVWALVSYTLYKYFGHLLPSSMSFQTSQPGSLTVV